MDQLRDGGPISQNVNSLFQLIPAKFREQNCEKEPIDHSKQDSGAVSKYQWKGVGADLHGNAHQGVRDPE